MKQKTNHPAVGTTGRTSKKPSWSDLVRLYPEYADKSDWDDLDTDDWIRILQGHPEFASCLSEVQPGSGERAELLRALPRYFKDTEPWGELDGEDWCNLLERQPQFAPMCNKWEDLEGKQWADLLEKFPYLSPYFSKWCDFGKLDRTDWRHFIPLVAFVRKLGQVDRNGCWTLETPAAFPASICRQVR